MDKMHRQHMHIQEIQRTAANWRHHKPNMGIIDQSPVKAIFKAVKPNYAQFSVKHKPATTELYILYPVLESSRTSPRPRGSSRTILKSLVLALRVESLALPSWLKSLEKLEDTFFTNHCMFCTDDFKGNNLEFCPLPIT